MSYLVALCLKKKESSNTIIKLDKLSNKIRIITPSKENEQQFRKDIGRKVMLEKYDIFYLVDKEDRLSDDIVGNLFDYSQWVEGLIKNSQECYLLSLLRRVKKFNIDFILIIEWLTEDRPFSINKMDFEKFKESLIHNFSNIRSTSEFKNYIYIVKK